MANKLGIDIFGGGKAEQASFNPFDGGTVQFQGNSHEDGGIDMAYGDNQVEVEGEETAVKDNAGDLHIMGNMRIPGTKTKFKQVSKAIAKKELQYGNIMDKGTKLVDENNPRNKFDKLKFGTGKLMMEGATQGLLDLTVKKNSLTQLQTAMLDTANEMGVDSIALSEGKVKQAKYGAKLKANDGKQIPSGVNYQQFINQAATREGVNPAVLNRLINQESGYSTSAVSKKKAKGIMQFLPSTAAQYGIKEEQLTSNKPEDVEAVINAGTKHFKSLLKQNNGDYKLALAAYNGGQDAVNFVKKKLGAKSITGDQWENFMIQRRQFSPSEDKSAWQNETFEYVTNIMGTTDSDFYRSGAQEFRDKHYSPEQQPQRSPSSFVNPQNISTPRINLDMFDPTRFSNNVNVGLGTNFSTQPTTTAAPNQSVPDNSQIEFNKKMTKPAPFQSKFDYTQIAPELMAIADNELEAVQAQKYQPLLFQPYQQSFQDRMNRNTSTFNAIVNAQGLGTAALSTLAAQKYEADAAVQAEEFRVNQGIANQVYNQNVQLLNDAQLKNLQIADIQAEKQARAKSNTKAQLHTAISSIANKYIQHKRDNLALVFQQEMFDYRPVVDDKGRITGMEYQGPAYTAAPTGGTGTAANQSTTVKEESGNVTTTTKIPSDFETQFKELQNKRRNQEYLLKQRKLITGSKG